MTDEIERELLLRAVADLELPEVVSGHAKGTWRWTAPALARDGRPTQRCSSRVTRG